MAGRLTPIAAGQRQPAHPSAARAEWGFAAGQKLVGRQWRRPDFSLPANAKMRKGASHPNRNAQFELINAAVTASEAADGRRIESEEASSVDIKKPQPIGDFNNGGRELRRDGMRERFP